MPNPPPKASGHTRPSVEPEQGQAALFVDPTMNAATAEHVRMGTTTVPMAVA